MNSASNMIKPVYRYEGTLARLMGDAVLASSAPPLPRGRPAAGGTGALDILAGMQPFCAQAGGAG
jgi:hypothetical protein